MPGPMANTGTTDACGRDNGRGPRHAGRPPPRTGGDGKTTRRRHPRCGASTRRGHENFMRNRGARPDLAAECVIPERPQLAFCRIATSGLPWIRTRQTDGRCGKLSQTKNCCVEQNAKINCPRRRHRQLPPRSPCAPHHARHAHEPPRLADPRPSARDSGAPD